MTSSNPYSNTTGFCFIAEIVNWGTMVDSFSKMFIFDVKRDKDYLPKDIHLLFVFFTIMVEKLYIFLFVFSAIMHLRTLSLPSRKIYRIQRLS